jgi:hypothetical protein
VGAAALTVPLAVNVVVVEFGFKFSEPFHGLGELGSELLVARRNSSLHNEMGPRGPPMRAPVCVTPFSHVL